MPSWRQFLTKSALSRVVKIDWIFPVNFGRSTLRSLETADVFIRSFPAALPRKLRSFGPQLMT